MDVDRVQEEVFLFQRVGQRALCYFPVKALSAPFVLFIDSAVLRLSVPSQWTTHQLSLRCQGCEQAFDRAAEGTPPPLLHKCHYRCVAIWIWVDAVSTALYRWLRRTRPNTYCSWSKINLGTILFSVKYHVEFVLVRNVFKPGCRSCVCFNCLIVDVWCKSSAPFLFSWLCRVHN